MTHPEIDNYLRSLTYDPRIILSVTPEGSTESLPQTRRQSAGNAVIICTTKKVSLRKNLDGVAILRPTDGVVFPGALVYADQRLMDGTPTPIALSQAPVQLSIDLPGIQTAPEPVTNPSHSSVQTFINRKLEAWNQKPASQGYVNAARSSIQVTTSFSSQQVALDLGFNAEWADGSMESQLNVTSNTEKSAVTAFVRQIFYTVTMDTPRSPGAVFAPDVTSTQVKQAFSATRVPGYVRSVDYGRLLMITMETSKTDTKANLKAAMKQTLSAGTKVGGSIDASYAGLVENATFSVVAIGGGAQEAAQFTGQKEDLVKLGAYIADGAVYRRDNPGAPISYTVAFLKDNVLAKMGFTTGYTETECLRYPNGFVKLQHDGAYVAKFAVSWEVPEKGSDRWESGEKTSGYTRQIDIPGDARNVKIHAEAATGLLWDPWGEIMNLTVDGATNKTYRVYGTTLDRRYDVK